MVESPPESAVAVFSDTRLSRTLPTAALQVEELAAGAEVGEHVIDGRVAAGGMGVVYRAHHASSGQMVAIKVMHQTLTQQRASLRRFEREARAVDALRHPSIVAGFDCGQLGDGRPYIVMEWLDGPTLAELLAERGVLPIAAVLPIARELCAALDAAHAAGIVHRDLKPSNVILAGAGAKLVDFGVAKLILGESPRLTVTGLTVGTPGAMAPEQILGQTVSPATDVYALGVMLYVALCGRQPFDATTVAELQDAHLHRAPLPPGEVAGALGCVDAVLLRCLEKRPEWRYPSAGELYRALCAAVGADERPRLVTRGVPAVGVHLVVSDDERGALRAACAAHGMIVVVDEPRELLAVAVLPADPGEARAARRRAVELAISVAGAATVAVHAAQVTVLAIDGVDQVVGGSLLSTDEWVPAAGGTGLRATDAALDGLDRDLRRRAGG